MSPKERSPEITYTLHKLERAQLDFSIGQHAVEMRTHSLDSVSSLREFEINYQARSFIEQWYSPPELSPIEQALGPLSPAGITVDQINNQFATKVTPCLMNPNKEEALSQFRSITPSTIDEEMLLLTKDDQFEELHTSLAHHLKSVDGEIQQNIERNMARIAKADRMQFDGKTRRSLEQMRERGMTLAVDPSMLHAVKNAHTIAGEGILPVTEYIKNEKLLSVSGFNGSKVSLAVHDFMDHLWTFDVIDRAGILDRYSEMFDSIGNPESTDIYKREGEIVASVAFGVRYFQTMPTSFEPIKSTARIEEHLDDLFVRGELKERHMNAYRAIKSMTKGSMDWQSLGFSFSNYITELDEQRRKYGRIKQIDVETKELIGELEPLSPDFVCFFIDTHEQLMSPSNKHRNDLFRFHLLLEEYLVAAAGDGDLELAPLTINLDELRSIDFAQINLPPHRVRWMRNNPGFTAAKCVIV